MYENPNILIRKRKFRIGKVLWKS